jgi:hypothetical protein
VHVARGARPLDGVTDFINGEEGQTVRSRASALTGVKRADERRPLTSTSTASCQYVRLVLRAVIGSDATNVAKGSTAVRRDRNGKRLRRAGTARAGIASRRTGVHAIGDIQLQERSTLHRPERKVIATRSTTGGREVSQMFGLCQLRLKLHPQDRRRSNGPIRRR